MLNLLLIGLKTSEIIMWKVKKSAGSLVPWMVYGCGTNVEQMAVWIVSHSSVALENLENRFGTYINKTYLIYLYAS